MHPGSRTLEGITARRAELDELEEQPFRHLTEEPNGTNSPSSKGSLSVRGNSTDERASSAVTTGHVGVQAVMLIPHRTSGVEEAALQLDCRRILAVVHQDARPSWPGRSAKRWEPASAFGQAGSSARDAGQTCRPRLAASRRSILLIRIRHSDEKCSNQDPPPLTPLHRPSAPVTSMRGASRATGGRAPGFGR